MIDKNELLTYVTGDYFEGDSPDDMALGSFGYISKDLADIKKSYFRLGFHLNEFESCKYYQQFGFTSLADFALHNWGLEASFVSRCIAVFKFTAQYSGNIPTMFQEDKYKPYSYSQLVEMVSMDKDTLLKCSPNYTVKELREIKKNSKRREKIATSQLSSDEPKNVLCVADLYRLHGAALSTKIKTVDSQSLLRISVYDSQGKILLDNLVCDVLMKGDVGYMGVIYLRATQQYTQESPYSVLRAEGWQRAL